MKKIKKALNTIKDWLIPIRQLAIALILLALIVGFIGYMADLGIWTFIKPVQILVIAFYANVSAELISIVLTILVIDALNERRSREQEKRRLILQMDSPGNVLAAEATRILRLEGWLTDGSLKRVDLWEANLEGADLHKANLERARLIGANLKGANLYKASLKGAHLWGASLKGAKLGGVNLKEANLSGANLERVDLSGANLEEADLFNVNLKEAHLLEAKLKGARLMQANLKGAHLSEANLEGAILLEANLEGANLLRANLEGASFEGATLPDRTKLPGRTWEESGIPEPDWCTPFDAWDKAGRPRVEPEEDDGEDDDDD